jgi:hypothetical protein
MKLESFVVQKYRISLLIETLDPQSTITDLKNVYETLSTMSDSDPCFIKDCEALMANYDQGIDECEDLRKQQIPKKQPQIYIPNKESKMALVAHWVPSEATTEDWIEIDGHYETLKKDLSLTASRFRIKTYY